MQDYPVQRATSTMTYTRCQMLWHLKQQGYVYKVVGPKEVASCLGTAFHAAAAHLMKHQGEVEEATALGKEALIEGAAKLYDGTRVIRPEIESELDALPIRLMNATKCLANNLVLFEPYEVIATELRLDKAGGTTIDMVLREKRTGFIGISDWKCKVFGRPIYKEQYIKEMATSWQLRHYVWGYTYETGVPVDFYMLALMDLTGKARLELYDYDINPQDMQYWHASAKQYWQDMQDTREGTRVPAMSATCRDQFGQCEMYRMCHEHQYRASSKVDYIKLEV